MKKRENSRNARLCCPRIACKLLETMEQPFRVRFSDIEKDAGFRKKINRK